MSARPLAVPLAHPRLSATATLSSPVSGLRFARGKRREALERLGIHTVRDLFLHAPTRYLDFSQVSRIGEAEVGQSATIVATIDRVNLKRPRPRLAIVEVFLVDETGVLRISFFRQPWLKDSLKKGDVLAVSGKIGFSYGYRTMTPLFHEVVGSADDATETYARVMPVHATTEGLSQAWMRRILSSALADAGDVVDFMPAALVAAHGLMGEAAALRAAHFPPSLAAASRARRRLAFDELLCLQVGLRLRKAQAPGALTGISHAVDGPLARAVRQSLPFALTADQERATAEILSDMASGEPMNRLLQGDVGTGKTAVAAIACAAAADSGFQAAIMAPTSVLASQYAASLGPVFDRAGVRWRIVTSKTPKDERAATAGALARGDVDVVFGTTALLSGDLAFPKLSLVVVDEQHRFGVNQRQALAGKGEAPDVLSMTATPIPRTLALSLYGDVAVSSMSERPVAGAGVATKVLSWARVDDAWKAVDEAVSAGQQAYVVCPLVDDADTGGALDDVAGEASGTLASTTAMYAELKGRVFPRSRVGLLHGRLSAQEKDEVMVAMRAGEIDILVCTTVVEVGVDVPRASVIVILDADRYGLATLHQLRGRVGRGHIPGRALLVTRAKRGSAAQKRLSALEKSSDGFELAELDLRLRHEGEVLGYRQSGDVAFRFVDLIADRDLVEAAHADAEEIFRTDPTLASPELAPLVLEVRERYGDRLRRTEG